MCKSARKPLIQRGNPGEPGSISATCTGDAKLDAGGDVAATAGGNISAEAGGNVDVEAGGSLSGKAAVEVDVEAPIMRIKAQVFIDGGLTVNGNIAATGAITDTTGNTNHHSH